MSEIYAKLCQLAKENGVDTTEFTKKIAKLRENRNIPLEICPCSREDKERGCISAKCMREINEMGICHCNCFKKREEKQNDCERINQKTSTNA